MAAPGPWDDLVEDAFPLPGETVRLLRPRDADALLDERAFVEHDEFLPYWAELWPAAEGLARTLAARRLAGMRILELGCGIALPSVVAALRGARVLATDWAGDALEVVRRNAEANDVEIETERVDWAEPEAIVARAPWPLVLASDVLYEQRMVDTLLALLPRLVGPGGEVLLADSGRPLTPAFLARAAADGFTVESRVDRVLPRVQVHRLRPARR